MLFMSSMRLTAQTYKTIDYPGAIETRANGINAFGQIVGGWEDSSSNFHGFLYSGGKFTSLDYPGGTSTTAQAINNAGDIVGVYGGANGSAVFLYSGGTYSTLGLAEVFDINDLNETVVGTGYVTAVGTFIAINDPNAATNGTDSFGINNLGQVVGFYEKPSFSSVNGFLYSGGTYTTINVPGQFGTQCYGINNYGEIVGYYTSTTSAIHSFTYSGGTFTSFDFPGTISGTEANQINDFEMIVGTYLTTVGNTYISNGFLALPAARNPVPFINQPLVPETLAPGSAEFTLTINGTGFVEGALVYWNGSPRQTFFQNAQQVTATINASDVAVANLDSDMVTILLGAGDGTFPISNEISLSAGAVGLLAADFNEDGKLDFAVGTDTSILILVQNEITLPTVTSLSLSPSTVLGGSTSTDTVTLSGPAPTGGATVALSSGNTAVAMIPAGSVTVPAAATSATFTLDSQPVTANTSATISANYNSSTQTAVLTVQSAIPTGITLAPATVIGGSNSTGTVALNGPAPAGATIALSSSNSAVASVPASVAPSGTTATFTVTTQPVASTTSVTISATYGSATQTATLTVQPTPALVSLSLKPAAVTGGVNSVATATLSAPAPTGGLVVNLSSSNLAVASPGTLTVAGGSTSGTATITTQAVTATTAVKMSATLGSVTKVANLTVRAATLTSVTLSPVSLIGASDSTATITLSGEAPAGGAVIAFSSSDASVASLPSSATVAAGATSVKVTVQTQPVSATTSVTISAVYSTVTRTAKLSVRPPALASINVNPSSVPGGSDATATVTLSGPAMASGAAVALSSSNTAAATVPASITVPAGTTTASATVSTNAVKTQTTVRIIGKYAGVAKSATLTVQ